MCHVCVLGTDWHVLGPVGVCQCDQRHGLCVFNKSLAGHALQARTERLNEAFVCRVCVCVCVRVCVFWLAGGGREGGGGTNERTNERGKKPDLVEISGCEHWR